MTTTIRDGIPAGDHHCDVLVIGAGPSGASCAYWLAKAGHEVVVLERKSFPREKTCGDGLTPRSVRQLQDMGLGSDLPAWHRYEGLRAHGFGRTIAMPWPEVKGMPGHGYIITRKDLDAMVAANAAKAGATLWEKTEAVEAVMEGNALRGARRQRQGGGGPQRPGDGPLCGDRRRRQFPFRLVDRQPAQPFLPPGDGAAGVLDLPPP